MKYSEDSYLQILLSGDEDAIKLIFDHYYDGLCLYAESIIRNHQVAEEIVEDIFIYLWENSSKLTIQSSVKNYLYRSIHNNCIKYLNKLKTQKSKLDLVSYAIDDVNILHPFTEDFPISDLIVKELEEKSQEILNALPSQCREIYELNRFDNLSYSEIAAKLGISSSTVKTQMGRAFQRFRENLKDYVPLIVAIVLFR